MYSPSFAPRQTINPKEMNSFFYRSGEYELVEWHATYGTIDSAQATEWSASLNRTQKLSDAINNSILWITEIATDLMLAAACSIKLTEPINTVGDELLGRYVIPDLDDELFPFNKGVKCHTHNITAGEYVIVAALYKGHGGEDDYTVYVQTYASDPSSTLNTFYFHDGFGSIDRINWTDLLQPSAGIRIF